MTEYCAGRNEKPLGRYISKQSLVTEKLRPKPFETLKSHITKKKNY